jgi:hypothetical protein
MNYSDIMLRSVAAACSCTSGSALFSSDTTFGLHAVRDSRAGGGKGGGRLGSHGAAVHCAGFHKRRLDLWMKRKVAYCGDAVLQHHALSSSEQLN